MSKTIWIDLTDFTIWRGVHTGTQRVVFQIARYVKDNKQVRFCSFDYKSLQYAPIEFTDVFANIEVEQQLTKKSVMRKVASKEKLKKAYALLAPPAVSRISQKLRNAKKTDNVLSSVQLDIPFEKGDVLVVLGGNWDKPHFINALEESVKVGAKLVHNINDLIPIFDKGHVSSDEHVRYEKYMKKVIGMSSLVTAISEYTKKDIQQYCKEQKQPSPEIYVMRLGDDPSVEKPTTVTGIKTPYILTVSTVEVRKNHMLLYYAYKEAARRNIDLPTVVIAGKKGWLTGDLYFMLMHDPQIKNKFIMLESPSDSQLSWLYQNCLFTVYPSYYEGWGLPVAESLKYNKVCLATNASSVPEIAGDLLDYFSPYNPVECMEGIVKLTSKPYRAQKEATLAKRYTPTLWKDTAETLFKKLLTI